MAISIMKGQKVDITKSNSGMNNLLVGLGWGAEKGIELDASAFLLGQNGKTSRDEDLVFYGNPSGGKDSITYIEKPAANYGADQRQYKINLRKIPAEIAKMAFTITIYDGEVLRQTFAQVNGVYLRILNGDNGQELCRFDLGNSLSIENALVVGELYRHNSEWKFNAIGSGFSGGLQALCQNFGIDVQEDVKTRDQSKAAPPVKTEVVKNDSGSSNIKLSKIELKKKGEKVNLTKNSKELGEILVNLNWNRNEKSSGGALGSIFGGGKKQIDLDLGCLFELKSGEKGVIQALGNSFGSFKSFPYISLDGDDRTGAVTTGENLRINGTKITEIKRILVFSYIYKGIINWAQADGIVTLKYADGADIEVRLSEHDVAKGMCAIALIENVEDKTFSIQRLVQFFKGHRDMDKEFKWGLRWVAGSKD